VKKRKRKRKNLGRGKRLRGWGSKGRKTQNKKGPKFPGVQVKWNEGGFERITEKEDRLMKTGFDVSWGKLDQNKRFSSMTKKPLDGK